MDVKCATCGEPWDIYHLRHDEVHETSAGLDMIEARWSKPYEGEAWEGKLTPFWRDQFRENGWEFGSSIYAVLRCNCCAVQGELPDAEKRRAVYETVSDCMAGDDDGVASMLAADSFETLKLFAGMD